jgi:trimeric autotransporter adhesin
MSTKTTFKRIALVAVAALGLGVLSVAPSSAAVSASTFTVANGNSSDAQSDTTTAAVISVSALTNDTADTITVTIVAKSQPTDAAASTASRTIPQVRMGILDTATANSSQYARVSTAAISGAPSYVTLTGQRTGLVESNTSSTLPTFAVNASQASYTGARFWVQLDSVTAPMYGTYTYTAIVTTYSHAGGTKTTTTASADVSIVVATPAAVTAAASTTVDPSKSSATLSAGATYGSATGVDSSVATLATASATVKGVIRVINNNAANAAAAESITVTVTGPGVVRAAGTTTAGKSIKILADGNDDIEILSDGTAGTASIVVATTSVTYAAKTVTFYAAAAKTITLSVNKPVIAVGASTDVIRATAVDANGNVWGGTAYIVAATAADALIAGSSTPVACSFNSAKSRHECPVSGTAKGTANFNVIDASTVALATATSASTAATRVSIGTPATAKIAFDKATYNPGEKALVSVTVLDAEGLVVAAQTVTNAFAADIATSVAFQSGNLTGSASPVIVANTDLTVPQAAGTAHFVVYMPIASGDVTLSATGSTGLAAAGRVAVSATASVVNSSVDAATDAANEATDAANAATDAALAAADAADAATAAAQDASDAVAALSASVSKLISSLRAQITSLTNLVIKIQKKVRA